MPVGRDGATVAAVAAIAIATAHSALTAPAFSPAAFCAPWHERPACSAQSSDAAEAALPRFDERLQQLLRRADVGAALDDARVAAREWASRSAGLASNRTLHAVPADGWPTRTYTPPAVVRLRGQPLLPRRAPPARTPGVLTGAMCHALVTEPLSPLALFGRRRPHANLKATERECVPDTAAGATAWARALLDGASRGRAGSAGGGVCDRNWVRALPTCGGAADRPSFGGSGSAPMLLGFEADSRALCYAAAGLQPPPATGPARPLANGTCPVKHGIECLRAGLHVLNVARGAYSMCRNLEFLVCGLAGALPGQKGEANVVFSTAPAHIALADTLDAPEDELLVSLEQITAFEVCIAHALCRNGHELFGEPPQALRAPGSARAAVSAGERWQCELDEAAFWRLPFLRRRMASATGEA